MGRMTIEYSIQTRLHLNTRECYRYTRTTDTHWTNRGGNLFSSWINRAQNFQRRRNLVRIRGLFFCFPDLSYAWTFNDNPLHVQEDNRRFVSQETGNLYIAKVEPSDVGNYTCFVTNREARRSVRGPPTPLVQRPDGKGMSSPGGVLGLWLSLGGL